MHVNPLVALCYYFSANAVLHLVTILQLIGMANFRAVYMYASALTMLCFIVEGMLCDLVFWRYGPGVVDHKLYPPAVMLAS